MGTIKPDCSAQNGGRLVLLLESSPGQSQKFYRTQLELDAAPFKAAWAYASSQLAIASNGDGTYKYSGRADRWLDRLKNPPKIAPCTLQIRKSLSVENLGVGNYRAKLKVAYRENPTKRGETVGDELIKQSRGKNSAIYYCKVAIGGGVETVSIASLIILPEQPQQQEAA